MDQAWAITGRRPQPGSGHHHRIFDLRRRPESALAHPSVDGQGRSLFQLREAIGHPDELSALVNKLRDLPGFCGSFQIYSCETSRQQSNELRQSALSGQVQLQLRRFVNASLRATAICHKPSGANTAGIM